MIYICDAIMGSGKTSAAMNYMNSHNDKRFIYITPYLSEVDRVVHKCGRCGFVAPDNQEDGCENKKINHISKLINEHKNIVTTHSSFKNLTDEMLSDIKKNNYNLVIDETIDVLDVQYYNVNDLSMYIKNGYGNIINGKLSVGRKEYDGILFKELTDKLKSKSYDLFVDGNDETIIECKWSLPARFIQSFKDVFVLTYMFNGQLLQAMFKIYNMQYTFIGVQKIEDNYSFTSDINRCYKPEYIYSLRDKIKIYNPTSANNRRVGSMDYSLSENWFRKRSKSDPRIKEVRKALHTFFSNEPSKKNGTQSKRMWSTYKIAKEKIEYYGYIKDFTTFNLKATNNYSNKNYLAYAVNLYVNAGIKNMLKRNGIDVSDDIYALSTMIQWIWRSAIRNGEEITIYIPSKRMRSLLDQWIDDLQK